MKKILGIALAMIMLLTGCTKEPTQTTFNVLCPTGAPTLAWVSTYEEITTEGKFDVVAGADMLVAELSKADSEYDIIVAPVNVGMKLITAGKSTYSFAGVITWGNLYVVGTEGALEETGEIGTFGTGAVPEKVYQASKLQTTLTPKDYGAAGAPNISVDLLQGKLKAGLLAEPAVTVTIAKSNGKLKVLADMQELFKTATNSEEYGYPQAAIFVKDGVDASYIINKIDEYTNGDMADAQSYLDAIGLDKLGLSGTSEVIVKSLDRQNVSYKPANEVESQLTEFLKLFGITYPNE